MNLSILFFHSSNIPILHFWVQRFVVAEQLIKEFLDKYGMGRDWSEFL